MGFIIRVIILFFCLMISSYAIQAIDFEKIIRKGRVIQAQILYILLSLALAYLVFEFIVAMIYRLNFI